MVGGTLITDRKSYSQIFEEQCPYFMSIGMSYEEYWYGENDLVKYYREAHAMRNKMLNQQMWVQGMYFMEAIGACLSKDAKYPKEPIDIYPKTEQEKREEIERKRQEVKNFFTSFQEKWNLNNGTD